MYEAALRVLEGQPLISVRAAGGRVQAVPDCLLHQGQPGQGQSSVQ